MAHMAADKRRSTRMTTRTYSAIGIGLRLELDSRG
jgi:hypothetical protein